MRRWRSCPGKTSLGKNNGHVEIGMKASGAPDVELQAMATNYDEDRRGRGGLN